MTFVAASAGVNLKSQDFDRLARFIESETGIKTPPSKKIMVEGRVRRRAGILGLASVEEYCRYVFDQGGLEDESVHLIDAVTTNKTDFFREPTHFRYIQTHILPKMARDPEWDHSVKVWSAASSIGAEAYTLAMLLAEFAIGYPDFRYLITGTDISTKVLETALRGVYPEEMVDPVPLEMRQKYLQRSKDARRKEVRISHALRKHVQFGQLNLMAEKYPMPRDFDMIFCRNVLIYFEKSAQKVIVQRLMTHLKPGGHLFLGHSEAMAGSDASLRSVANSIFVREE